MHRRFSVLLLISLIAHAQQRAVSPSWAGTWKENPEKSTIFIPGTLSIEAEPGGRYVLVKSGGQRTPLSCVPGSQAEQSCFYLTALRPSGERARKMGVEYRVNAEGTELEVDNWRIVPDGSRLTDTDDYARSSPSTGFAGRWRKTRSTEAPTVYRISLDGDRMAFVTPDGEVNISFSLAEARRPQGAYVAFGPARGNSYRLLGPSKLLERSIAQGKVTAQSVIILSPDGQTMTEDHTDAGRAPNPLHIVYDRK